MGIEPGGNDIVTCHYWNSLEELTETCTAFVLRDNVNATLSSCCSDSSRYAVRLGDYSRVTINGLRIIYAAAMIEKYAKVSDCVIIDSAEDPANPSKYYSSCTAHITGLEIKAQTSVNLKILSDYLFNRYKHCQHIGETYQYQAALSLIILQTNRHWDLRIFKHARHKK